MTPPPSSPMTPSRSRPQLPSNTDLSSPASSHYYASSSTRARRRSSRTSQMSGPCSPVTPRQQLSPTKSASLSAGNDSIYDDGNDRHGDKWGNLADELADAWDDDGAEQGSSFLEGLREGNIQSSPTRDGIYDSEVEDVSEMAVDMVRGPESPRPRAVTEKAMDSPTRMSGNARTSPTKRRKRGQSRYDGPQDDFGIRSEEGKTITPGLDREMAEIELLATQCLNEEFSIREGGGVISRTTTALKDLGSQASIETAVTRLVTACSSVASHRTAKPRDIFTLAHSLLLTRAFSLTEEEIDGLLCEIELLSDYLHLHPASARSSSTSSKSSTTTTATPLQSLHSLSSSTSDLAHTLQSVSDLIQESRQASATASRLLKAARDLVAELRQEDRACEEGIRYVEEGGWNGRLCDRQAASICGDVVAGFESSCEVWRDRLFGGGGGGGGGSPMILPPQAILSG